MSAPLLLDTHVFLWWSLATERLSARSREHLLAQPDDLRLSVASAWEIAIKRATGRLQVPDTLVERSLRTHGLSLLPIELAHCRRVAALPLHHRDPFDRMLVAQALEEGLPLVSADARLDAYGVKRIW